MNDDVRARFEAALALEHETERKLVVVSIIDELVQRIGFRAIVIGGLAVEFWTHGRYSTSDIDLYLPHGPAVDDLLGSIGFVREGRHWVLRDHDLFVEAPASFPADEEEVAEVTLRGGETVLLLSAEDVLIYRLHEFLGTGHADVAEQCVALLAAEDLDYARLVRRSEDERITPTLVALEQVAQRLRRGEQVETYELHEISKALGRDEYDG